MAIQENIENDLSSDAVIEKKVLLQIILVSTLGIVLYIVNGLFFSNTVGVIRESVIVFVIYLLLYVWAHRPGLFVVKKRVVSLFILVSVISGFFSLGGFRGVAGFDLINMFLFISVLFQGKERSYSLALLSVVLLGLFYVQVYIPEVIQNRGMEDPEWMFSLNVLLRIGLTFNIGMALRSAYSREHKRVEKLLQEIHTLNADITTHNEELKSMQEELKANNDKLESLVQERTRKLELQNETLVMYAYMNSHVFRGPICRIQGILNLLELEGDENIKTELHGYLLKEVKEIDKVVKDISLLLYESDADFIEEIRMKAKRLYNL